MTKDEIRALLNDLESDRVERTISTTNTDKFGQAICAFANDLPDHRQPGYFPPVRYKGRIWIRIGPRKGVANENDEHILMEKRRANVTSFD